MARAPAICLAISACAGTALLGGCASLWKRPFHLPVEFTVLRGQLVIHSDFPVPANHRLLEELAARRTDLQDRLHLPPSDEPIHIYLFASPDDFREFVQLRHPSFPTRRAFFLETDTQLQIYAQWGDRLAEDLRHEVTHGYLHSMVSNLPLWLDEGLAEYAEAPRGQHGLNPEHLTKIGEQIRMNRWAPDLARLESLDPAGDLTQAQYAESWAWVHFLLETRPERAAALGEYLAELRGKAVAEPLSAKLARLDADPGQALIAHLREWLQEAGLPTAGRPAAGIRTNESSPSARARPAAQKKGQSPS
jgi:hypothetical protein